MIATPTGGGFAVDRRTRLRLLGSRAAQVVMYLFALLALVPLSLVLIFTISKGLPALTHLSFFTQVEKPVGIPDSGISHAIAGTMILVGLASLMALPVGIIAGVFMAEYPGSRWTDVIRLFSDVLVGAPSIAIGLFVYAVLVAPVHHFSGYAGSVALAILMLPVVARTTEGAVLLVPGGLRESGLALGLPRSRVALQLILPAAAPGVITGALLAIARAGGETAPLLFTSFGNRFFNLDPSRPVAALPLVVYHNALTPYPELQEQAWGAALVLMVLVLAVNLGSRYALRRQLRMAGNR